MDKNARSCKNCDHSVRSWVGSEFRKCSMVGSYCSTELMFGRNCAQGRELLLWSPKVSLWSRIKQFFGGAK